MKFSTILIAFVFFIFINSKSQAQCSAGAPVLSVPVKTACSVTLAWPPVVDAATYEVKYKISGADNWLDTINIGNATSYTVEGLLSSTKYKFKVTPYCSNGDAGTSQSLTSKTKSCTPPSVASVSVNADYSVFIDWDGCASNYNAVRYRLSGELAWISINTNDVSEGTITGLTQGAVYEYQVKACSSGASQNWSAVESFTVILPSGVVPNIILIVLDDARYDVYPPSGGPSFFTGPNISRIANEGATFKNFFVTLSICNPSRATILTGLFPDHHRVRANKDSLDISIPTIGSILHDHGYYTALIGKYPSISSASPRPGWDYWMASVAGGGEHQDGDFNINGTVKEILGYKTDVLTDSALRVINSVSTTTSPFMIMIAYSAPHEVTIPPPGKEGIFDNDSMPVPETFYSPYTQNYPSFLDEPKRKIPSYDSCVSLWSGMFEMMQGVDDNLKRLFDTLTALNILDNTMIMFTSDNGYLLGEHQLKGKAVPYEASMRVPLFVRYPVWFSPGTVIDNSLALNADIAPTILDAAKIPENYGLDGISVRAFATDSLHRDMFYFESGDGITLSTIRTERYKLNRYNCTTVTKEFFDLLTDPDENNNLINTASYASMIDSFEIILDSLKIAVDDTLPFKKDNCYLVNPVYQKIIYYGENEDYDKGYEVFPTLSEGTFTIRFTNIALANISVFNLAGQLVYSSSYSEKSDGDLLHLPLSYQPPGLYQLSIEVKGKVFDQKIVIQ